MSHLCLVLFGYLSQGDNLIVSSVRRLSELGHPLNDNLLHGLASGRYVAARVKLLKLLRKDSPNRASSCINSAAIFCLYCKRNGYIW
jgi:hypothetical protein